MEGSQEPRKHPEGTVQRPDVTERSSVNHWDAQRTLRAKAPANGAAGQHKKHLEVADGISMRGVKDIKEAFQQTASSWISPGENACGSLNVFPG